MRSRLVSFLGTGNYTECRHRLPDGSLGEATRYISRALGQYVAADEIAVIATAEAEAAHGGKLVAELRAANLPPPDFRRVPKGENKAELWRQFEVMKEMVRAPAGTEVALDITHAYRSQPFFAAAITGFVRAVDPDPAPLRIFYAAFEPNREGPTPVWELTPFVELVDWAQRMMLFLRTGRSAGVAETTEAFGRELAKRWAEDREVPRPVLDKLGRELRAFGANLETIRTGALLLGDGDGSATRLAARLEEARAGAASLPPLADVLDRIRLDMVEPLLGASDHLANEAGHRVLAGLARQYLEMGRWAEAAAIVREGWITHYASPEAAFGTRNEGRPGVDALARAAAEARWNKEVGNLARSVAQVRNDIEHAGFNARPDPSDALQRRVRGLVERFAGLPAPPPQTSRPPVFVNLSNHPVSEWSRGQRAAALRLAPEIRDWGFPPVPPEAEAAEIAALAERIAKKIGTELPGATHAMVQGEFTLAHALVRRLQERGVVCLAATTRREVLEDSGTVKTTRFEFVRFREYG
jgi:CRISPR-associated protein Csx16